MTTFTSKFTTICSVAVLALGMAACGGGGNGDDPVAMDPAPMTPTLDFSDVTDGQEIPAGAYTVTGLPDDTPEGAITIPAGMTESFGGVDFTCADDTDCTVTRAGDTLTTTGAFTVAIADTAPVDPGPTDPPPTPVAVDLSDVTDGYMAEATTVEIAPGMTADVGDITFTCPTDGGACMVEVMADGTATSTGGMATAMNSAAYQSTVTMKMNLANQRTDISSAITAAQMAVDAVHDDSTDEQVDAAATEIMGARVAIAGASDVPDEEKAANTRTVDAIMAQLTTAKTARMAAQDAANEEQRMADAAMAATAAKLYAGIGETPLASGNDDGARDAGYGTGDDANNIALTIDGANPGFDADDDTTATLTEDKKTTVSDNYGWEGKRYTAEPDGDAGTYEAIVYSNVEDPEEGRKFGSTAEVTPTGDFEYVLTAADATNPGETATLVTGSAGTDTQAELDVQARIASPSFNQSAGSKEFELPANTQRVMISGSYHGVSGTYNCSPTADETCSATVAAEGFALGGGTWTFKPGNSNALIMSAEDTVYESYGWWLHKSESGETFTASAFVDTFGTAEPIGNIINALQGTATYMGGAAGKYALSSSTGGTNDAGHFTARATLEADFTNNEGDNGITGTLDNFMGADDQPRNWEVELKGTPISDTGTFSDTVDGTVWTIDGTDADAAGQWSGSLQDNGDDGVPKVATGTFHSTYGTAGRMVGGFGADKR